MEAYTGPQETYTVAQQGQHHTHGLHEMAKEAMDDDGHGDLAFAEVVQRLRPPA